MGLVRRLRQALLYQRGNLFGWLPVGMATGIALYFGLKFEPGLALLASACCLVLGLMLLASKLDESLSPIPILFAMVALGFFLGAWRAHSVAGPVLDWRYYGPVEGRIVGMDRSASDAIRLTLDRVKLDRVAPVDTPTRVRVSLHGDATLGVTPEPGLRVMTTAHLSPPGGPVEPGGFDFQRHAWFAELGAVGYSRVPLVAISQAKFDWAQTLFHLRMSISDRVRAVLPGDVGGFAAAVTTGDRSGIGRAALEALRASNTAHLLAISGLHMGLLTGFVFGLLRISLALIPAAALRWPVRKLAACGALAAAVAYLGLSGGNVATERAFVMVSVALCALLIDRRAISIRGVAVAALIVLTLRPEALMGPGFQMSFAATTALVAVFGWMRDGKVQLGPKWVQPVVGVILASAISGIATAPVGAAHFNAVSHYGLVANFFSVPLMGLVVIPAAVLAVGLSTIGLEAVGLWIMGQGLSWILWVSETVAGWEGSRSFVPGPDGIVLPLMALGALFVILWQGRARVAGVVAVAASLAIWQTVERPAVLIDETGNLVGVMKAEGRALSRAKGAGFVARNWLENDGEQVEQAAAASRWSVADGPQGTPDIHHLRGKRALASFDGCAAGDIVVANGEILDIAKADCILLYPELLRATGAIAIVIRHGVPQLVTARDEAGDRMWSGWTKHRRPDLNLFPAENVLAQVKP